MAILECRGLSLEIDKKRLLSDISFTASPGINVIAGENGSGKSLILKCIISAIERYTGDILVDGKIVRGKGATMAHFGYIPTIARSAVIGESGLDDVLFGIGRRTDENIKAANSALVLCSAESLAAARTDCMSTGELRRINIASQLVLKRDILLLDEPFTGLDYQGSLSLIKILLMLKNQGKTIVIVSHDLDKFLKYADSLVIIKKGEIVASGVPESLLDILEDNNIHRPFGKIEDMAWE